jgi:hypothetical protein
LIAASLQIQEIDVIIMIVMRRLRQDDLVSHVLAQALDRWNFAYRQSVRPLERVLFLTFILGRTMDGILS